MERNKYLESDGLYFESETHEWFNDKTSTGQARRKSISSSGEENDDALDMVCFVVRNKSTGEYDRVLMDVKKNEIVYNTKSFEDLAFHIDRLKISKRFKKAE